MMTTVTISMPDSLKDFLDHEVQTKGYGNVSEYIRGLLRQAQTEDSDARLQALLLQGLAGAPDTHLTQSFWRNLKKDAAVLMTKHRKPKRARTKK